MNPPMNIDMHLTTTQLCTGQSVIAPYFLQTLQRRQVNKNVRVALDHDELISL